MTKTQLIADLAAEMPGTTKTHVRAFLNALEAVAAKTLKAKDGKFMIPGILKILVVKVSPKPERKARNPATGAVMTVPAKAAGKRLKARFLKRLKVAAGQIPQPEGRKKK